MSSLELSKSNIATIKQKLGSAKDAVAFTQIFFDEGDPAWKDLEKAYTLLDAVFSDFDYSSPLTIESRRKRCLVREAGGDSSSDNFDKFIARLKDRGINPKYDEAKSEVGKFAEENNLDPNEFYAEFLKRSQTLKESHERITSSDVAKWSKVDWRALSENLMGEKYMSEDDAAQFIASKDGDEVADQDVIDETSGEVYIKAGNDYRSSPFNADHVVDKDKASKDRVYAARTGTDFFCPDCDELLQPTDKDHVCAEPTWVDDEDDLYDRRQKASDEFHEAAKEFADTWVDYKHDHPDVEPEGIAADAADGFFWNYPQWKEWSRRASLSKTTMKSIVADYIHEVMTNA